MCGCLDGADVCAACGMFVEYQEVGGEDILMFFVRHEVEDEEAGLISSVWTSHTRETCAAQRRLHWLQLVEAGILDPDPAEEDEDLEA